MILDADYLNEPKKNNVTDNFFSNSVENIQQK